MSARTGSQFSERQWELSEKCFLKKSNEKGRWYHYKLEPEWCSPCPSIWESHYVLGLQTFWEKLWAALVGLKMMVGEILKAYFYAGVSFPGFQETITWPSSWRFSVAERSRDPSGPLESTCGSGSPRTSVWPGQASTPPFTRVMWPNLLHLISFVLPLSCSLPVLLCSCFHARIQVCYKSEHTVSAQPVDGYPYVRYWVLIQETGQVRQKRGVSLWGILPPQ